jgi:bifunctional DNA-binding transcriptional regulator/antitoxin component of YhaV-PrlF toxin-antitoxin module
MSTTQTEPSERIDSPEGIETVQTNRLERKVEVGTRGRIYLTTEDKRQLGIGPNRSGYGTELWVVVIAEHTDGKRLHRMGEATVQLQTYGEFVVPKRVRDHCGVEYGDEVWLSAEIKHPFDT